MHSGFPHRRWRPVADIQSGVWTAACAVLATLLINHCHSSVATLDAVSQSLHHPSKLVF